MRPGHGAAWLFRRFVDHLGQGRGARVLMGVIARRQAGDPIGLIGVSAGGEKDAHQRQVAALHRADQRRLAAAIAEIDVGAALDE